MVAQGAYLLRSTHTNLVAIVPETKILELLNSPCRLKLLYFPSTNRLTCRRLEQDTETSADTVMAHIRRQRHD